MTPILHIHGQHYWHDGAVIVGNRAGLERLRDAVASALAHIDGVGSTTAFVADGEGYHIQVKVRDHDIGHRAWEECLLPYVDPIARGQNTGGEMP